MSKVSSKWYYHFRCVWPGNPKLSKIKSLLFLFSILRNKWMMKFIFCMQVSMNFFCKLVLWFWWGWSNISKVLKTASLQCLYNISKKKLGMKLIFLHADKHKSDLMSMMKYSQSNQSNKLANLCNIPKRKFGMEYIFCIQINIKGSKSQHYRFWWKQPDMPKIFKKGS